MTLIFHDHLHHCEIFLPVSLYLLFLTKRSFYLVFNKAATIVLKRISSLHRVWWKYKYKFSVCILYPVCSLHFVPSLHLYPVCSLRSTVCSLHFVLTGLVLLFLFERALSANRKLELENILVRLSLPLWLICGLYVEKLTRKSKVIEQWLLYTNWRRTQMRGLPIWAHLMLFRQRVLKWTHYGSLRCEHFGFSTQVAFSEVRKCDLKLFFFIKPYKHVISFHVNF